jgi:glycerophosphoryl diester phosphodiesterase
MAPLRRVLLPLLLLLAAAAGSSAKYGHHYKQHQKRPRYVIAHRGASGVYPEQTVPGYAQDVEDGADFIECGVVVTKDRCAPH